MYIFTTLPKKVPKSRFFYSFQGKTLGSYQSFYFLCLHQLFYYYFPSFLRQMQRCGPYYLRAGAFAIGKSELLTGWGRYLAFKAFKFWLSFLAYVWPIKQK